MVESQPETIAASGHPPSATDSQGIITCPIDFECGGFTWELKNNLLVLLEENNFRYNSIYSFLCYGR